MSLVKDVAFIASKDVQYLLRERVTLLWLILMPVVFMYFIGTVISGFGQVQKSEATPVVLTKPANAGFLTGQVEHRLEQNGYQAVGDDVEARRELVIPDGFTESVLSGQAVVVQYRSDVDGLLQDLDALRIGRALYTVLADVVAVAELGETAGPESFARLNAMPAAVNLTVEPAGKKPIIPTGFEQAVPGMLVMFTLLSLLTSGAATLVIERDKGLLRRLASSPISRGRLVTGKWLGKLMLGIVQVAVAMFAGTILFGMAWGSSWPAVVCLLSAWAGFCASCGLLLGTAAKSEGQAVGFGVFTTMFLASLGGCWWPIEITPQWMQNLQISLPTGWAMDGMHRLVSFGEAGTAVLPHIAALAGGTLVLGFAAARNFRYQ